MEINKIIELMTIMGSVKRINFTSEDYKIWCKLLKDFKDDDIKRAFHFISKDIAIFPHQVYGKLIEFIDGKEDLQITAEEGWVLIEKDIARGKTPGEALLKDTVDFFGGYEEVNYLLKDFDKSYYLRIQAVKFLKSRLEMRDNIKNKSLPLDEIKMIKGGD